MDIYLGQYLILLMAALCSIVGGSLDYLTTYSLVIGLFQFCFSKQGCNEYRHTYTFIDTRHSFWRIET